MTEFRSFIFERQQAKNQLLIDFIIVGLFALGVASYLLEVTTFWTNLIFIMLPLTLTYFIRFKSFKFGRKEKLNGHFTDELLINSDGIKIANKSIPIDTIKSLSIKYDNIYGDKSYSAYSGMSRLNGETNILKIEFADNKVIQYNFKLASIGHAKQLFELTDLLKEKVTIKNDWRINYNA